MPLRNLLRQWRKIIYLLLGLRIVGMLGLPTSADFLFGWIPQTGSVVQTLLTGGFPSLSIYGVYIGIEIILAPFYWLWTALPIEHPDVTKLIPYTVPWVSLEFIMKIPIFLFDLATLVLIMRIVRRITNSEQRSIIAGLAWFANPYDFYILYWWGAMDIIPIAVFLLAVYFEVEARWLQFGFATMLSALMRLFAFAVYPFFMPLAKTGSAMRNLILGSAVPIFLAIGLLYLSHDTLATVFNIPAKEFWLLEFLGFNLWGMQFIRLSPVLVLFQLYVVFRFWRPDTNIVYLASVSLLALLVGATLYGGEAQHFLWVSPLLSACVAMRLEDAWIYCLTFFTAILSPTVNPFYNWTPEPLIVDTFLAGAFYAMKATYLLRLNLWNTRSHHQSMGTVPINAYNTTRSCLNQV